MQLSKLSTVNCQTSNPPSSIITLSPYFKTKILLYSSLFSPIKFSTCKKYPYIPV